MAYLQNPDTQPLFMEPIFRANVQSAISAEQIEFIKNLKMVRNQTNLISENLYIFEEPELASIKDAVQEALDYYAKNVMGIDQQLYVTQSWSLVNNPTIGMHGHSHSNSVVSGSLYFCDIPNPSPKMIFDRHRGYQQLQLLPDADKRNIYNTSINAVEPKVGEVVLFSSSLQHLVEPNMSNEDRYSIAFNTFIRGTLGNFRDVSELKLP
ncbi:MAG: 2OG-Fe(II) oxygenase family protein [Acidiferrobacterales bacterium]|nr:2OG-Fe(II) oxygenase family protein [Acidiferrobacterales bacterium]